MKKLLCAALALFAAVLCGCSDTSDEELVHGGTYETWIDDPVQPEQEDTNSFTSVVIFRPDGINDVEYISRDNGVTWYLDGEETEPPELFLTMLSRSPVPADSTPVFTLHYTGESYVEVYPGQNSKLEIMRDGKWEELKYTGATTLPISCFTLYGNHPESTSVDIRRTPEYYGGGAGQYRFTILCNRKTCRIFFDVE